MTDALLDARARVVHDLVACESDDASAVDVVESATTARRWWLEVWPAGAEHLAGLVAQDVQERLLDEHGRRWPPCRSCDDLRPHELRVEPELGPDPHWVCDSAGLVVAPVGGLPA